MLRVLFLIGALCATFHSAAAQQFVLKDFTGAGAVWVWKDKAAHDEAMQLINAGVHKTNPMMVMVLVACIVDPGTKIIMKDMGFVTHDIMIVEGPKAGCRGNIPAEALGSQR
ncbi:hypothetical protein [Pannonibacter sp. SL95]|uniref:hypothetical protein n=1 Tax=Pannonibacter sp. SL95 TaxID=2995153 RepID=UPI002275ACCE|nr:hypothetical protein [Pannonibacter sp. SL95]MCY1704438.1 hypothetical protein [Pannonibacter sp. SL95]